MIISSIIQQMSGLTTVWENKDGENSRLQDSHEVWQEDGGFQEAVENWLGGPSDHESAPVGRIVVEREHEVQAVHGLVQISDLS